MSVNKPTKITPPKKQAKPDRASLLERASGAFGLDNLRPAAVPKGLDSVKAKKFAPKRAASEAPPEPTPKRRESDYIGEKAETAPAAARTPLASSAAPAPKVPSVRFSGEKREVVRSFLSEQGLIDPDGGASPCWKNSAS